MNEQTSLDLELRSEATHLPHAREQMRAWLEANGWTEETLADVVLAVDEALTNVIRHGYEGKPGNRVELAACAFEDPDRGPGVQITIRDYGKQVPLDSICSRALDDLRPGGLGVHIIRSMMDSVSYSHAAGGGMRLVMRKYRCSADSSENDQADAQ